MKSREELLRGFKKGLYEGLILVTIALVGMGGYYLLGPAELPPLSGGGDIPRQGTGAGERAMPIDEAYRFYRENAVVFLDARDPWSYQQGRLPGALNIQEGSEGEFVPLLSAFLAGGKRLVAYCSGKNCRSALNLVQVLEGRGVKPVAYLVDGWGSWQARGYPRER